MEILFENEEQLRKKINFIQQKEKDIDEREFYARQILSEQIEDLRAEEILLTECEQRNSILLLENVDDQLLSQSEFLFDKENNEELKYIINIENDNKKKKKSLNSRKSKIEMLKKSINNSNHCNYYEDYLNALNLKIHKNRMNNFNNSCKEENKLEKTFFEKKSRLESIQKDIIEKENKVLQYKNEMELRFNEKISIIETLTQKVFQIKNNIKMLQYQNHQIKIKISSLQQEKGVFKRQIDKSLRYLKILTDRNTTIKKKFN